MQRGIFISYRRDDTQSATDRLRDRLKQALHPHPVFLDIFDIPPGRPFQQVLEETLGACAVVLVVIGNHWLRLLKEREASVETDWVRREVETALASGLRTIPVLVEGAALPAKGDLPATVADLVDRQKYDLVRGSFIADVDRLADLIRAEIESRIENLAALAAKVEAITHDLDLTRAAKDKLATDLASVQAEYGGTVSLLSGFLASVVGSNVPPEQFARQLFDLAAQWKGVGARIDTIDASHNLTPGLDALRAQAKAAYDEERIADVEALLAEIERLETAAIAELDTQAKRLDTRVKEVAAELRLRRDGLIETKRAQLAVARTRLQHDEAARLIADIADLSSEDEDERLRLLANERHRLFIEGSDLGLNASLEVAIAVARIGVERARGKNAYGGWLNDLGIGLLEIGEREAGIARLEEAAAAMRAALAEVARERMPVACATVQLNLGNALRAIGLRESGTFRLEEAVRAYRLALEERLREQAPLDWASVQNSLGSVLRELGDRETGTKRHVEAVVAFRAALEERTRERAPLQWAMTQNNLGTALHSLGERQNDKVRFEEAVTAYRFALQERSRERVPLLWATTQSNLGNALWALGEYERGTAHLEEAIVAHRAALRERTRERVPLLWAASQSNLALVLAALGERETGTARLDEAVAAYRAALEEWTRERVPLDWAMAHMNLGNALQRLGTRESGTARLEEAVAAYHAALEEFTPQQHAYGHDVAARNLDFALAEIARRRE